jgi:eukaryotic-like serine/threonine-protein kinase
MPLASHIQLPERYRVTRHIASGGMASVWEVEDLLLGRVVAVKVLGAHYAADIGARARFQREARTAARVSDHPHIATIYDIGEHGEDAFIVMEFFSGGTVADQLRAAASGGGGVPRKSALRWLREAASGLDHAHAAGIVHRDVKPANLLLDGQERVAVGDFGIARLADDTHMTQTGQLLGTAAYLSPEQAVGQPAAPASDRYAFSVVAYELLTGKRPFAGGPPTAQVRQHAEAQPLRASAAAPGLPAAIDPVFARGLAKEPAERPLTAVELVDEIEHALAPARQPERTKRLTPIAPAPAPAEPAIAPAGPAEPVIAPAGPAEPVIAPAGPAESAEPVIARGRPRETPPAPPREPPTPARKAPPRQPPAAAAPPAGPAHAPGRRSPLVAIGAAAAVVGAVLAIALANTGDDTGQRASTTPKSTTAKTTQNERARTPATTPPAVTPAEQEQEQAPAQQPTQAKTTTAPAASSGDAAALNLQGHALNKRGSYAEAVPLLQSSVEKYRSAGRTNEIGYAYALYNLGVALNRSGNPAAAVDVLEQRMKYRNQLGDVRRELRDAQAKLGGGGGGAQAQTDKDDADPGG